MASINTGETEAATLLRTHFDTELMERLKKELIFKDLVNDKVVPNNRGKTVAFHRIQGLPLTPVGLSAGIVDGEAFGNAHSSISSTAGSLRGLTYVTDEVTATLNIYGADMSLTELLMLTSEPNPLPELMDIFLVQASATMDQKIGWGLSGNTTNAASATVPSATYNAASVSVTTVWGDGSATLTEATLDADNPTHLIAAETFNTCRRLLRTYSVPYHNRVPGGYVGVISPGQAGNLRLDGTFQEIALKGFKMGESKFENAEVGKVFGIQVLESPHVSYSAGTVDATNDEIHRAPVWGNGYFYNVSHAKGIGRPRVNFIAPSPSAADVYGNNGFISWKYYWAGTVVNPLNGVIIKTATTGLHPSTGRDNAAAIIT